MRALARLALLVALLAPAVAHAQFDFPPRGGSVSGPCASHTVPHGNGTGSLTCSAVDLGSDVTGTLALSSLGTLSANTFVAAPNGSSGSAAARFIVDADLPNTTVTPGTYAPLVLTISANGRITGTSTTLPSGGVLLKDTVGGLGGDLFVVSDSTGANKYLDVTASSVAVRGALTSTGYMFSSSTVYGSSNGNTFDIGSAGALTVGGGNARTITVSSATADGASAVGTVIKSSNTFATAGALELQVSNAATQVLAVDKAGFLAQPVGGAVASATTIAPTGPLFHVTGTTAIATISLPYTGFTGCLRIVPDGLWTTTTGGNIAIASTAVVSRALEECYDGGAAKWYPSY